MFLINPLYFKRAMKGIYLIATMRNWCHKMDPIKVKWNKNDQCTLGWPRNASAQFWVVYIALNINIRLQASIDPWFLVTVRCLRTGTKFLVISAVDKQGFPLQSSLSPPQGAYRRMFATTTYHVRQSDQLNCIDKLKGIDIQCTYAKYAKKPSTGRDGVKWRRMEEAKLWREGQLDSWTEGHVQATLPAGCHRNCSCRVSQVWGWRNRDWHLGGGPGGEGEKLKK